MFDKIAQNIRLSIIRQKKKQGGIMIADTTIRGGGRMPGVRFGIEEKVKLAGALAQAGVHSIDAGFPGADPLEVQAVKRIARETEGPIIMVYCRPMQSDIDLAVEALAEAGSLSKGIQIVVGSSPTHREIRRNSKADVVKTVVDAVTYARRHFEIISFGPEDASRTEPDFLHEIYREAIDAGVTAVGFADTAGILIPQKAADAIKGIQDCVPNIGDAMLGVHFHNDLGLATANTLACIGEGINVVQGTINGIGDRAGNTAIEEVVAVLNLHQDLYKAKCSVDCTRLKHLSRLVRELSGMPVHPSKPIVGENVFLPEAGVQRTDSTGKAVTYVPFPPEMIGDAAR